MYTGRHNKVLICAQLSAIYEDMKYEIYYSPPLVSRRGVGYSDMQFSTYDVCVCEQLINNLLLVNGSIYCGL